MMSKEEEKKTTHVTLPIFQNHFFPLPFLSFFSPMLIMGIDFPIKQDNDNRKKKKDVCSFFPRFQNSAIDITCPKNFEDFFLLLQEKEKTNDISSRPDRKKKTEIFFFLDGKTFAHLTQKRGKKKK